MIERNLYIDKITSFIDKPFIKVITGLRRSGKSSILHLIKNKIVKRGISENQIIYLNFESFGTSDINNAKLLYKYVKDKIKGKKKTYIFLDEIQEVKDWEKAVNSFLVDFNVDIYITGSNSKLLSSELSTLIAGRYVAFQIQTLSFGECLTFNKKLHNIAQNNKKKAFEHYLKRGGFPLIYNTEYSIEDTYKIVFDIYSSAVLRDTIQRHHIRDVELLERVVKYVFDNVGNSFSAQNVADYFKSQQRKVDLNTIYNYLNALESAFIIHPIPRYDIKGKEILKTQEKYFVGDPSLIYGVMGYKDRLISGILENIVMLELKRRDYKVFVGKIGNKEIDFIAEKGTNKIYIQVSFVLASKETIEREFSALLSIPDNFPKFVVSTDDTWQETVNGVKHYNIADFLLLEKFI